MTLFIYIDDALRSTLVNNYGPLEKYALDDIYLKMNSFEQKMAAQSTMQLAKAISSVTNVLSPYYSGVDISIFEKENIDISFSPSMAEMLKTADDSVIFYGQGYTGDENYIHRVIKLLSGQITINQAISSPLYQELLSK